MFYTNNEKQQWRVLCLFKNAQHYVTRNVLAPSKKSLSIMLLLNTLMNINVTFCYHKSHQIKGKLRITQVIEII